MFAHRFTVPYVDDLVTPGRYDDARALRIDDQGAPVVEQPFNGSGTDTKAMRDVDDEARLRSRALAGADSQTTFSPARGPETRADRDRPDPRALGTVTFGPPDRDDGPALLLTKTAGGRDADRSGGLRRLS
jgi:hypothetical protein